MLSEKGKESNQRDGKDNAKLYHCLGVKGRKRRDTVWGRQRKQYNECLSY